MKIHILLEVAIQQVVSQCDKEKLPLFVLCATADILEKPKQSPTNKIPINNQVSDNAPFHWKFFNQKDFMAATHFQKPW